MCMHIYVSIVHCEVVFKCIINLRKTIFTENNMDVQPVLFLDDIFTNYPESTFCDYCLNFFIFYACFTRPLRKIWLIL